MADLALRITGLAKEFQIGGKVEQYSTLRDSISNFGRRLRHPFKSRAADTKQFWALQDVSFDVHQGDIVGIVGHNGAGKSTLLKILSRITGPTKGRVEIHGRIAPLLELGTGFHPELSGRENIILSGAILGMRRAEILRKFDEIVAFAEIEQFIDTPVKRYSSGMYLRLAFAVAAHLDAEIIIVDEVLAVGDAGFQRKCINKMGDAAANGRTVLFVTHNMNAIRRWCTRGICLDHGTVVIDGDVAEAIQKYESTGLAEFGERRWDDLASAPGDEVVRLRRVAVLDATGEGRSQFTVREPVSVEIVYDVITPGQPLNVMCYFVDEAGQNKFVSIDNLDSPWKGQPRPVGRYRSVCHVPGDFLNEGLVRMHVVLTTSPFGVHAAVNFVTMFVVVDEMDGTGVRGDYPREWPDAHVRPRLMWDVTRTDLPAER